MLGKPSTLNEIPSTECYHLRTLGHSQTVKNLWLLAVSDETLFFMLLMLFYRFHYLQLKYTCL